MILLLLSLLSPTAHAGAFTAAVAGGPDFTINEVWTGVDLALHPTQRYGWAFQARLTPAWGFIYNNPLLFAEVGVTAVLPEDEATLRLGLIARGVGILRNGNVPLGGVIGEDDEYGDALQLGVSPSAMLTAELELGTMTDTVFTIGGRAGAGAYTIPYCIENVSEECEEWSVGFVGAFTGRMRLPFGLSAELWVGTTMQLSIGYAF